MALTLINSNHSFIRFGDPAAPEDCIWGDINFCLPVYDQEDAYFQFVIQGTQAEIDSLCTQDNSGVEVSLVEDCDGADLLVFTEKPQRFRLGDTQILYNWSHGLPNFTSVIAVNQCFRIKITISGVYAYAGDFVKCSNCFERIPDDCYTSVIEYGNEEDAFGFKYCYGGEISGGSDAETCESMIVNFINESTLSIPYTAGLLARYGNFPTVQAWIYDDGGQLTNMGITITFDTYPPNYINLDFGGPATGIVIIK